MSVFENSVITNANIQIQAHIYYIRFYWTHINVNWLHFIGFCVGVNFSTILLLFIVFFWIDRYYNVPVCLWRIRWLWNSNNSCLGFFPWQNLNEKQFILHVQIFANLYDHHPSGKSHMNFVKRPLEPSY